jgi:HEAT repeat protein
MISSAPGTSTMALEPVLMANPPRRRFGRLFYATAGLAVVLLGSQPFWEPARQRYRAWQLTGQLHDPTAQVRDGAAAELMQIGPAATWWVARASRDPDVRVRLLCCNILERLATIGDEAAAEALLAEARDADPSVRAAALSQLPSVVGPGAGGEAGPKGRALRSMGTALEDPDSQVRQAAAWALARLGPKARPAVPELERALEGPDKALRPLVANLLLDLDPEAMRPRVIAALSKLLADTSIPLDHWRLISVLVAAQGQDATAAMLIPLLRDRDYGVRSQAINDLVTHCREAESLRPILIECLESGDGGLRQEAALYLLAHDPGMAAKAIETLAEQVVEPRDGAAIPEHVARQVRESSPGALDALARSVVERLPRARDPEFLFHAIVALGEIGPDARCAVPALLEHSHSGDLTTATRAVEALVKIDPKVAESRIPALLDWTTPGREGRVRLTAISTLRDFGPVAKVAVRALLKLADEDDLAIAAGAIEAIGRIDPSLGAHLKQAIERGASRPPD